MVHSRIPLFLPLLFLFLCSRTRERIERTMESQVSFYSRKRYRLRAFIVRTRKIDREEVVGEHKTHSPSFFINVFTTVPTSSSAYPTNHYPSLVSKESIKLEAFQPAFRAFESNGKECRCPFFSVQEEQLLLLELRDFIFNSRPIRGAHRLWKHRCMQRTSRNVASVGTREYRGAIKFYEVARVVPTADYRRS